MLWPQVVLKYFVWGNLLDQSWMRRKKKNPGFGMKIVGAKTDTPGSDFILPPQKICQLSHTHRQLVDFATLEQSQNGGFLFLVLTPSKANLLLVSAVSSSISLCKKLKGILFLSCFGRLHKNSLTGKDRLNKKIKHLNLSRNIFGIFDIGPHFSCTHSNSYCSKPFSAHCMQDEGWTAHRFC